jgi:hypothetical protein
VRQTGTEPASSVDEGADATLRLISGADVPTGTYFHGSRQTRASDQAYDAHARHQLKNLSEMLLASALR